MKKSEIGDLRKKSYKELYKELKEAEEKLRGLKIEIAQAKVKNHQELPKTKKKIAKILTIISEKQWKEVEDQEGEKDGK